MLLVWSIVDIYVYIELQKALAALAYRHRLLREYARALQDELLATRAGHAPPVHAMLGAFNG